MLVCTIRTINGLEKNVYIKDTFIKENHIYLDAENKDLALTYNKNILEELIENKIIRKEDGTKLINEIKKEESQIKTFSEWIQNNQQATEEDKRRYFDELTQLDMKEKELTSLSIRRLIAVKDEISNYYNKNNLLFYKNLDTKTDFGMTKPVADRVANIPQLLIKSTYEPLIDNSWKLSAKFGKNDELGVELEYTFLASSEEEANKLAEIYKDTIIKGGLKVLLAFWKMANNKSQYTYSAPIRDIMALYSGDRDYRFNMEERKRFWARTRLLENTKLSIPITKGSGRTRKQSKLNTAFWKF